MILVEARLLELVALGAHGRDVCQLCARTQALIYKKHDHILTFTREGTWARLCYGARNGRVGAVLVPCMRCDLEASIATWNVLALAASPDVVLGTRSVSTMSETYKRELVSQCRGETILQDIAAFNVEPPRR